MEAAARESHVEAVSVVIGARDAVACLGLKGALAAATAAEFRVLTTSTSVDMLLDECRRLRPAIALVDMALLEGADNLAHLSGSIVVYGRVQMPHRLTALLRRGVRGVVAPESSVETIAESLCRVAAGGLALPRGAADDLVEHLLATADAPAHLSPRERDVLRLVARGFTSKRVAAELHVGERTVKTHLSRIAAKLETRGRAATVAAATERGLI